MESKLEPDSVILETLKASVAASTSETLTLADVGLSIVPSPQLNGLIVGSLTYTADGNTVNFANGTLGVCVPRINDRVENMESDAL